MILDCLGKRCPLPVIELARHIVDIEPGATIRLLADDPAARVDVPAWCRMRGHEYVGETTHGGSPAFDVRRIS